MKEENYNQPSDAFVQGIDVHTLLPQQEPFVMIDKLTHFDMVRVATSTEVRVDNMFVEKGVLSVSGLTENIAQTCAARIGYINKCILKKGIQIGFIGAIRNLVVNRLPSVGERIDTEVVVEEEIFGMVLATAEIKSSTETLVSTVIKIAVKEA